MSIHLNETKCKANILLELQGQGHSERSKVTFTEFVTVPYMLNPLSDLENISHICNVHLNKICRVKVQILYFKFKVLSKGQFS